jgi:DNA polymerase II small subunit
MEENDIIKAVMAKEYQISPEAVELIKTSNSPEALLKYVFSTVNESVIVIGTEHIDLKEFAIYPKTSKQIYVNPCLEFSADNLAPNKNLTSSLKEEIFSEGEVLSTDPRLTPNSVKIPQGDEPKTSVPDTVRESTQITALDAISPQDKVLTSDSVFQAAPDPRLYAIQSEEEPDSYLVSNSLSPVNAIPKLLFSPRIEVKDRPASSFFGSPPSHSSNGAFKLESSSSKSNRGLFSKDEGQRHFPGKNPVTVISDITGHSSCVGEYIQFVQYFRDRYSRLSEIIRRRINARPIESIKRKNFHRGERNSEEISIIGMISDISTTINGHKILSLEDPTGSFSVLIRNADKELFELASTFLLDEVIGVTGSLNNHGNLMIVTKLTQPDVPNNVQRRTESYGKAVLISDVHVGSSQFLEDAWLDFLDFLKGEASSEDMKELASSIRYLIIAGDLVDGIGIYPDQEMELDILDVYEQYRKAAEYLREIPEHIRVIISPGNHDAVRQAEPQPALPEKIQADFPQNVIFVGNPALVDLDGVRILIYHGRSIDDLVATIPGISYQEPAGAVLEMVKRRHLAPTYGSRVSISPEKKDYFVIDPLPDIIHTGHVHTLGVERYKNILLINSGTWQTQTEFQKRVNLIPVPAKIPIVDLANCDVKILGFD